MVFHLRVTNFLQVDREVLYEKSKKTKIINSILLAEMAMSTQKFTYTE